MTTHIERHLRISVLSLALALSARGAFGQLCGGSQLNYFMTGNDSTSANVCGGFGTCATPMPGGPSYTITSGCDPHTTACGMTATIDNHFTGLHTNLTGFGYSWGEVDLISGTGSFLAFCGTAGAEINQDFGVATVGASVTCSDLSSQRYTVNFIACPTCPGCFFVPSFCTKVTPVFLDFGGPNGARCLVPPPHHCGGGGSGGPPGSPGAPGMARTGRGGTGDEAQAGAPQSRCEMCQPTCGGGQSAEGGGPSCAPAGDGGGAFLRYRAGGVGGTGFPGTASWTPRLGRFWSHDFAERIVVDPVPGDVSHVWLLTRFGTFSEFQKSDTSTGNYLGRNPSDEYRVLSYNGSGAGCGASAGFTLLGLDGTKEYFRADGYWCQTTDRDGNSWLATYDTGDPTQLDQVSFPDGRFETYTYDSSTTKLATITEHGVGSSPPTRTWTYVWSGNDLAEVDRPDGTSWLFTYGDSANPGYVTLMTLSSGSSSRVEAGFAYDSHGNTIQMWKGDTSYTGAGAVEKYSYSYNQPVQPTVTTLTDPLGVAKTFTLDWTAGNGSVAKITELDGECGACGLSPVVAYGYGDGANPLLPTSMTDGNGNVTQYQYDAAPGFVWQTHGILSARTEAASTPLQRLTTWTHGNSSFPLFPTEIDRPSTDGNSAHSRKTTFGYDSAGNLQSQTEAGFEAGSAFSFATAYGYNTEGQTTSIDPPGFGTGDEATFSYGVAGTNNQVPSSRTDPIVGSTGYAYDAYNRRVTVTDPNGAVTETQYDDLDRVTAVIRHFQLSWVPGDGANAGDLVTSYLYDCPSGTPPDASTFPANVQACSPLHELRCVSMPNGNAVENLYDSTNGRLVLVRKKADCLVTTQPVEQTRYTYNNAGNRTRESRERWNGSAWVEDSATKWDYSVTCHPDAETRGDGSSTTAVTSYCYDLNNNLTLAWDPDHPKASFPSTPSRAMTYDALNRLTSVTLGSGETTHYAYDVQDHLAQVTDAELNVTSYTMSDRDLMTTEVSPATGTTTYAYDAHGQLTSHTDARGITTTRTRDVLDRITHIAFGTDVTTDFTYDDPAVSFSKGHLTKITEDSTGAVIGYTYDRFGRTLQDGQVAYAYDKNGNRTRVTYPALTFSGSQVAACYGYDVLDREISLGYTTDGTCTSPTSLVSSVGYLAAGPPSGLTLGNGVVERRSYDARYYPTLVKATTTTDLVKSAYSEDAAGNILGIDDQTPANQDATFTYQDYQYFLTGADGPWGSRAYTYDRIGNRLTETNDGGENTYSYTLNSSGHDTPLLSSIELGDGEIMIGRGTTLDYSYDAMGNVLVGRVGYFTYDGAARLASASPPSGEEGLLVAGASMTYDGRGLLATASRYTAFSSSAYSYSSDGVLYQRVTGITGTRFTTSYTAENYLYFGGRPVAVFYYDNSGALSLTYLTTNHLDTPILATDGSGAVTWSGGFEPFGSDYTAAQFYGIFQRLPGQLDDDAWDDSWIYHNVNRWYEPGTGRYLQADPVGLGGGANLYAYADLNPLLETDILGLLSAKACGTRYIGVLGGVNHVPIVGPGLDKAVGNNLLGFCAKCPPNQSPTNGHLSPTPPAANGIPDVSLLPRGEQAPGMEDVRKQCGGCKGPNELFIVANVKTRLAITQGGLNAQKAKYSLDYDCKNCKSPK